MKNLLSQVTIFSLCFGIITVTAGCSTQPGPTTGYGAAAGTAIGAGLGAIIGSQTGDPGTGLMFGAAAGAGTGALVANQLEGQEKIIARQDEAIHRQTEQIKAQSRELNAIKGVQDGRASFSNKIDTLARKPIDNPRWYEDRSATTTPEFSKPVLENRGFDDGARDEYNSAKVIPKKKTADAPKKLVQNTSECSQAADEMRSGDQASEPSERLFHYRRALRLCPDNADYHAALGEAYLALDRKDDAKFEFERAIELDPKNKIAHQNLVEFQETSQQTEPENYERY